MKTKSILLLVGLFVGLQSFEMLTTNFPATPISEMNALALYQPTIDQNEGQLNIQFTHNEANLMRVVDVNGEGPDRRYIVRYAPVILNSPGETAQISGMAGDEMTEFADALDIATFTESNMITVEIYTHDIDYADPMSLSDPKGKGSVVVNDNTTED